MMIVQSGSRRPDVSTVCPLTNKTIPPLAPPVEFLGEVEGLATRPGFAATNHQRG
jgi:hypothetical protein